LTLLLPLESFPQGLISGGGSDARIGLVGFLGVATLFEAINEGDDGRIFPGIGGGFRYTVITDNHMNVGLDVAVGDGDWGIYFRLGEAF
jgi:hypothetical protein